MNKKTEIKQSNGKHMIQGPGPGRPKGSKNTVNKQVLQDVFTTYQELGGVEYLKELALQHPRLFVTMLTKLIPSKTENEHEGNITIDSLINAAWDGYEDM